MVPVRLLPRLVVRCRRRGCCRRLGCFLLVRWGRVFLRYTVWVVWFIIEGVVEVRGVRSCGTFWGFSFRLFGETQQTGPARSQVAGSPLSSIARTCWRSFTEHKG